MEYSKEEIYYVYLLLDPRKYYLPFYVGKGKDTRWNIHLTESKKATKNIRKWNKIQKIRKDGFEPIVIFWKENMKEEPAYDLEEELIARFGRIDFDEGGILTNICDSARPPAYDDERREKYRQRMIGNTLNLNRRQSKEEREKKSLSLKEIYKNGKRVPSEKQLKALDQTGKIRSPETRKLISEYAKNRSPEHQKKITESLKGKIPWNKDKKGLWNHTKESKRRISESGKRAYASGKRVITKEEKRKRLEGYRRWQLKQKEEKQNENS